MSKIELKNIDKYYGKNHVLKDVSLTIEDGDFMTLLGPSGCGKTTTLRVVSGLEKPQSGTMLMDGKEVINTAEAYFAPPSQRGLNLVFQSYALWPHMTVRDNIAFGLNIQKHDKKEVAKLVEDALRRMQILQYIDRYPSELSGGQQQRVSIGRALMNAPAVVLADEPTGNLDSKSSHEIVELLKMSNKKYNQTLIMITHDENIALQADRIIALEDGRITRDEVKRI